MVIPESGTAGSISGRLEGQCNCANEPRAIMNAQRWTIGLGGVAVAAFLVISPVVAQSSLQAPWDSVGRILQANGAATGGYYRFNFPRRDLKVHIGDLPVAPGLALGSWAGFDGNGQSSHMMGDLVLTGSELKPVL